MNAIINANFNGNQVKFRNDGYINATSIAKQYGKQPRDFLKSEQTQEYISALAQNLSTKRILLVKENQLVIVKNGGSERGTWLHPKLAIFFARWLSAEFAVWCDEQIENIITPKSIENKATTNTQQQHLIKEAVNRLHYIKNETYQSIYRRLYIEFQVPKYQDILAKDFDRALSFLSGVKPEPKKDYVVEMPFDLRRNSNYLVQIYEGKIKRSSIMLAYNVEDTGKPWGTLINA